MKNFNRGQLVDALAQFFGLKGSESTGWAVDATVLATVGLGDLTDSPYLRYSIPIIRGHTQANVAAENSVIVIRPGAMEGTDTQLQQIILRNAGATPKDLLFTMMTNANVTTAGLTEITRFIDVRSGAGRPTRLWAGSHTAVLGSTLFAVTVPADDSLIIPLPTPGVILPAKSDDGVNFAVWNETQDENLTASFIGREWPAAG